MKELKLKIKIDRSPKNVFDFVLDPKNTPVWIDSIVEEKTNQWPVSVGAIYKNKGESGKWSEYTLIEHQPYEVFEMLKGDNNYHVRYTIRDLGSGKSELEYFEWVEKGVLEEPFSMDILEKLKTVIESQTNVQKD